MSKSNRELDWRWVRRRLLSWYRANRRDLPWRRTRDPYRILVSEFMLQQTQVATVLPYYDRFLKRFPSLSALARADEEEVVAAWSGLGYYRRARNLHRAAKEILRSHRGRVPRTVEGLRSLPGIGPYTAGAVASIAFGLPEPALDGNLTRVLSRLLGQRGSASSASRRRARERGARELLQKGPPGDLNQSLMELGALHCQPDRPQCSLCPLEPRCLGRTRSGLRVAGSSRRTRKSVSLRGVVGVVRRGGRVLLVRRVDPGLMTGLWELPGDYLREGENAREGLLRVGREKFHSKLNPGQHLTSLRHQITFRRIRVEAYQATLSEPSRRWLPSKSIRWVEPKELEDLPHGSVTRRVLQALPPDSHPDPGRRHGRKGPEK